MPPRRPAPIAPFLSDAAKTLPRRRVIAAAALAMPAVWRAAVAQPARRPTPAQTEGPFYPLRLPADTDADLLVQGARRYAKGTPVALAGTVVDTAGRPLSGAVVEIWQCDADGRYHHPGHGDGADPDFQGFGRCVVDAEGRYAFRTMRPSPYVGRTPHIHVKLKNGGRELLTTQLYVDGDPGNARDALWRRLDADDRAALTRPFAAGPDGLLQARFPIVVAA